MLEDFEVALPHCHLSLTNLAAGRSYLRYQILNP